MFIIKENTWYVLCNFSSVEFSEFNEKIQIGKLNVDVVLLKRPLN